MTFIDRVELPRGIFNPGDYKTTPLRVCSGMLCAGGLRPQREFDPGACICHKCHAAFLAKDEPRPAPATVA